MPETYHAIEVDPARNMAVEFTTQTDSGALKSGQVRIDVLTATINPADLLTLEGRYGVKPKRRYVPGSECVGNVSAVAADVTNCAVGDLVIPMGLGAWRERIVSDARSLIVLPGGTDVDQAAMLKANPATALVMLEEMVALSDGDWVLLNAANSAVGQNVIKLAKARGLRTAAVVRRQQAAETVGALGCDLAIVDDGTTPFQLPQGGNVRLALDAIGGRHTARLGAAVADGGTYGLLSSEAPQIYAHVWTATRRSARCDDRCGALMAVSTGIIGAAVVTMGLLALPVMLKNGYSAPVACGAISATGTLGQIISPSIVLIFLGGLHDAGQ